MTRAFLRVVPATLLLVACGSARPTDDGSGGDISDAGIPSGDDGGIADGGPTDGGDMPAVYPAPHPPMPEVVDLGGSVLASPRVVPVFFADEDASTKASVIDFLGRLGTTDYWAATTAEYGVGAVVATAAVELTENAPGEITDAEIQAWLAGKLNGDDPAFPAADENTIYVLHYPRNVNILLDGSTQSCEAFGGYHSNISLDAAHDGVNVAYAVLPHCPRIGSLTELDVLTDSESHEIIEASTDPYPESDPAFALVDDAHFSWLFILGGGEASDLCAQNQDAFTKFPPELPYTVQRSWSNQSASDGHDPCVPAIPGAVYFNTAPVLNDDIPITYDVERVLKGVQIPVGESRTIELDLYSDGDTGGPWDVRVVDAAELFGQRPALSFALDKSSGQNGDKLQLTITALQASHSGISEFLVISSLGERQNFWVGTVGN